MTEPADSAAVLRFRTAVADGLGLRFDDAKLGLLAEVLDRRRGGAPTNVYLQAFDDPDRAASELRELARELTVGETYFFRHGEQFRAFAEAVVPDRMAMRGASRELRVLSAGCASGDEAYTLAILLLERAPGWRVSVRAVDANPAAVEKATRARYTTWSLRETPDSARAAYFTGGGRELELSAAVREVVVVQERNLAQPGSDVWQAGAYDVVFCRNVLMYFSPEAAQGVIARIHRSLAPGGYLFLGHAETLRGLSVDFHLRHTHGTFYYQRKEPDGAAQDVPAHETAARPAPPDPGWATTWLETVRQSSEKIRALAEPRASIASAPPVVRADEPRRAALTLLAEERFGEALDRLDETAGDAETLLLRAVLLAQRGETGEAEAVCARLLALDGLSAGAYYVLALCREGAGDHRGAVEHDLTAAYLDPGFAMPRLHLGLMAARKGDHDTARRELGQAVLLLRREDASRVLLFGGGFGREALVALCKAELTAAGARP